MASALLDTGPSDLSRVAAMLTKYADVPADFADVSLAWLAQQKRIDKAVTVADRDFAIYRSYADKPFKSLLT